MFLSVDDVPGPVLRTLCYLILSPQHPQEASTTMISISQMRKQKLKEMKLLRVTQRVTAGKGTQTMVVSCYDGASCGFKSYGKDYCRNIFTATAIDIALLLVPPPRFLPQSFSGPRRVLSPHMGHLQVPGN